ncbi:MBL fold metallo-hydrolase [Arthrobacter sp. Marseille-P9274]|uniref:MBL fold metallo-hydrolase n=1 Tax=Arthrobacter sp. Marseille-P9274 TaxID=2866572 RepID=UPI0021C8E79D|nr:MBL fold metallo-hydrolase [Arthrobacter sp. Marseille-P9274]
MTVNFTLVGGPTAVLELDGVRIILDPTFDASQTYTGAGTEGTNGITKTTGPAIAADSIGRLDVALVSHDHHVDNLDVSGREVLRGVPTVFTTKEGAERLGQGAIGLADYEAGTVRLPGGREITVTGVPAHHGPEGVHQMAGPVVGFIVSGQNLPTVYVSGDNSSLDVVRDIKAHFPAIDLAVLFTGGAKFDEIAGGALLTLSNEDAVEATRILDPRLVVPVHAEGWAHFSQDAHQLRAAFEKARLNARIVVVEPGQTCALDV